MEKFQLLVVQTGGTIDKDYPKRKGGYSFEICDSGALSVLRKVSPYFRFRLVTACLQDSQDLTDHHRQQIVKVCKEAEEKYILVTHGTDTILQTAAFLAKHLQQDTFSSNLSKQAKEVIQKTAYPCRLASHKLQFLIKRPPSQYKELKRTGLPRIITARS